MKKIPTLLRVWWHCTRQFLPQWVLVIEKQEGGETVSRKVYCAHSNVLSSLESWVVQGDQGLAIEIIVFV